MLCPPSPGTQVEGALLEIEETPLKGKDASSEQSVEGLEPMVQPSIAILATKEHTCPKILICGEWRKVLDSYPKDASG